MNLKDLIKPNQIFALFAKAVEGFKVIGINVIVARYYGPELFGLYSYVLGVLSIVAVLAEFRLQSILVKEYSTAKHELKGLLGSALVINIVFALLGFSIAFILSVMESDPVLSLALLVFSLSFFYKIPRLLRGFFISKEKNILILKCELLASCFTFLAIFIVLYNNLSISYLIFARSLDFLLISVLFITTFYLLGHRLNGIYFDKKIAKNLILSASPLVLSGAAMLLFQRVDIIIVREYLGDHSAGLYSSATNMMLLFSLVPLVISESLAPKMFKAKDKHIFAQTKLSFSKIIILVGVILSILMASMSYILILVLYGEQYLQAYYAALILSSTPLLLALGSLAGQIIVAENTQNWSFVKSILGCIVTLVANFVLVPFMGIEGAALSTVIGLVFANFIGHYFIPVYRGIFALQLHSLFTVFASPFYLIYRKI